MPPQEVKVIFVGDASPLFRTFDEVESRGNNLGSRINDPFKKAAESANAAAPSITTFANTTTAALGKTEAGLDRVSAKFATSFQKLDPFASAANVSLSKTTQQIESINRGAEELSRTFSELGGDTVAKTVNAPLRETNKLLDEADARAKKFAADLRAADPFQTANIQPRLNEIGGIIGRRQARLDEADGLNRQATASRYFAELRNRLDQERIEFARNYRGPLDLRPPTPESGGGLGRFGGIAGAALPFLPAQYSGIATAAGGLSASAAAVAAPFAAAAASIATTYKITSDIRTEAERRLHNEETLNALLNKNALALKDSLSSYEKSNQLLRSNAELTEKLTRFGQGTGGTKEVQAIVDKADADNKATIEKINGIQGQIVLKQREIDTEKSRPLNTGFLTTLGLQQRYSQVEQDRAVRNGEAGLEQLQKDLAEQQANLNNGLNTMSQGNATLRQIRANQDSLFDEHFLNWKKSQDAAIAADNEQIGKIRELAVTWRSTLTSLTVAAGADNPFTKIFIDADQSLKDLRKNLRGLPEDMQKSAIETQQRVNATNLFRARVDNAFDRFDIREEINRLRKPQSDTLVDKQRFDQIVKANVGRDLLGGSYGSNLARRAGGLDKLTDDQKRSIYEVELLSSPLVGNNRDSLIGNLARERVAAGRSPEENERLSAQDRLDRAINLAGSLNPKTDEEKAIIDQRIISLSRGVGENNLRQDQRENFASALERQDQRKAKLEEDGLAQTKRLADAIEKANQLEEQRINEVRTNGAAAVRAKLDITVRDQDGRVSTVTSPTPDDVNLD